GQALGENETGGNDKMTAPRESNDARRRSPRRNATALTAKRLENAAAAYIARYDASSARLRAVLIRRVRRAQRDEAPIVAEVDAVVDGIVARYTTAGVLDDA